ncbi:hypothetical protein GN956_G24593 [Arapaima gigas]
MKHQLTSHNLQFGGPFGSLQGNYLPKFCLSEQMQSNCLSSRTLLLAARGIASGAFLLLGMCLQHLAEREQGHPAV